MYVENGDTCVARTGSQLRITIRGRCSEELVKHLTETHKVAASFTPCPHIVVHGDFIPIRGVIVLAQRGRQAWGLLSATHEFRRSVRVVPDEEMLTAAIASIRTWVDTTTAIKSSPSDIVEAARSVVPPELRTPFLCSAVTVDGRLEFDYDCFTKVAFLRCAEPRLEPFAGEFTADTVVVGR